MLVGGYKGVIPSILDRLSWVLTIPWAQTSSLCLSALYATTHDSRNVAFLTVRYAVIFPLLACLTLLTSPIAIAGYFLRIALSLVVHRQPFIYAQYLPENFQKSESRCPDKISFLTANVILCPEIFVRFNNNRNMYWRMDEIPRRLLRQNPQINLKENQKPQTIKKEDIVIEEIPHVDVLLFQEVCERLQGWLLWRKLRHKYPYCIYDVTRHRFSDNCCLMASGLFLCSQYPIIEADFEPFHFRSSFGKYLSYGVLTAKLELGVTEVNGKKLQAVGYISNLHTQAYQGKEPIISSELKQAQSFIQDFIKSTWDVQAEALMFSVFGGDFNFDNMSPGDSELHNHSIWSEYKDVCMKAPGQDHPWCIGTELRQPTLSNPEAQDPHVYRTILLDDVLRRHYVLDADVLEQTMDLMSVRPEPEEDGRIIVKPWGGQRRIDKLLVQYKCVNNRDKINNIHPSGDSPESDTSVFEPDKQMTKTCNIDNCLIHKMRPASVWTTSSLAGLSDHLPFILEAKLNV